MSPIKTQTEHGNDMVRINDDDGQSKSVKREKIPGQSQGQPLGQQRPKRSCKAWEGAPSKWELSQNIHIWRKTLRPLD